MEQRIYRYFGKNGLRNDILRFPDGTKWVSSYNTSDTDREFWTVIPRTNWHRSEWSNFFTCERILDSFIYIKASTVYADDQKYFDVVPEEEIMGPLKLNELTFVNIDCQKLEIKSMMKLDVVSRPEMCFGTVMIFNPMGYSLMGMTYDRINLCSLPYGTPMSEWFICDKVKGDNVWNIFHKYISDLTGMKHPTLSIPIKYSNEAGMKSVDLAERLQATEDFARGAQELKNNFGISSLKHCLYK